MWFPLALVTAGFWGGSDLFSKMGTDPRDKFSHLKLIISVGACMGVVGIVLLIMNWDAYSFISFVKYLPVSLLYIFAMLLGYLGLRYLDLSVSSPVCNGSGALAALLCFIFLDEELSVVQFIAIILVAAGTILLSVFDVRDENKARRFRGEVIEEKYKVSLIAVLLPVFYCLIDAAGTFGDAVVLDNIVTEMEAEISYYLTFLVCALAAFIYVVFIKKQRISLKEEKEKGFAALCETAGQFFYIFAISDNPVMAAPLISAYCIFSVVFSRIFLKEKLTPRQYLAILIAVSGIVIMGFYDA